MSSVNKLFEENFLEYASYVIRDRAIPDIIDGFKPVQRRIIHTLLKIDDGRFNKVANVTGETMKYHPHGDASIYEAIVNLTNHNLFIEGQGNFGNFLTGDKAAAGRYIECRLFPLAKKVLYNPEITEYVDSYDGRNKEPVVFPAKLPVVVIQGTSGIAVGMKTDILPHNLLEVIEAQAAVLRGEEISLFPDFPSGGIVDVSQYQDGCGYVSVRAKLDTSDPKKIIITELPYGVTSEQMIDSIEDAAKKGKLHIASINDYTAESANIEINLQRNTYTKDMVDALYAYTKCENKISLNPIVIQDSLPKIVPITEIVRFHASHLVDTLKSELIIEKSHLQDRFHARTLERIFIEERIYKKIETKRTQEDVVKAVYAGFKPFKDELFRELCDDDIETLLKIPIRRISLFDIEKNKRELEEIQGAIDLCDERLNDLISYALYYLDEVKGMLDLSQFKRKTDIGNFDLTDAKQIAVRNLELRYDESTGYIGTNLKNGEVLMKVSPFDKIFYMRKDGCYRVTNVSDKEFIGTEGIFYCNYAEKELLQDVIFTIIFKEKESKFYFINRFTISAFQTGKLYSILPKGNFKLVKLSTFPNAIITAKYKSGYGYRVLEESFRFADFTVRKTAQTMGSKLINKQLASLTLRQIKDTSTTQESEPNLFDNLDGDKK